MAAVNDPQPLPQQNGQTGLCGFYYDKGDGGDQGDSVAGAQTKRWFTSKALSGSLLKRLNSIQLVTSSNDGGSTVAGANRSWFKTNGNEYDGDCIQVHAAADHMNSRNQYYKGTLVFGVGCEDSEKPVEDSKLRTLLGLDSNDSEAASSVVNWKLTTPEELRRKIQQEEAKAVMGNLNWESWDSIEKYKSLAAEAKDKKKHVLLVFDAEDLPDSTAIDRRLSWGQTVENIWNHVLKERCNSIWQESRVIGANKEETFGNNYFHLLVQLGLEGAIYKGFQEDATKVHLIYEPTSAKGGFLRSYSDKDMEKLRVSREGLQVNVPNRENLEIQGDLKILGNQEEEVDQGQEVKELMKNSGIEQVIETLRDDLKRELKKVPNAKEKLREKLWEKLRKQLRKDVGDVWMESLKSSLEEESTESIENLGITQIRDAIMTGIRWSRRCAPMMFPKRKAKQSQPADNRLKLETDSEPVLVSVELDLRDSQTTSREPLVLRSLPCTPKKAAVDTLKQGFECVLPYMPSARFGNLVTADRGEVDGFRRIANKVHEWYTTNTNAIPLTLAVFGQPGSGKSFGVKEVIKSILAADGKGITDLEFNLSQFRQEDDLRHAFEVIRDKTLSEQIPVVFFDEFDSTFEGKELGWLSHFIKPITEGKYEDGGIERPLGRGIYIFIGGTKTRYDDFFRALENGGGAGGSPGGIISFEQSEIALGKFLETIPRTRNGFTPTLKTITVNISGISQYDQLKRKFYEIRDATLEKNIPLVFFRDFDCDFGSEKLGWLKYFLAPMQDGEFFDHGSRHLLGRAIFVFEQGSTHFNGFPVAKLHSHLFPGAKLPDFVSRLRGQIQIPAQIQTPAQAQIPADAEIQRFRPLKNILTWYLQRDKSNKPLSIGLFRECRGDTKETFKSALKGHVDILGPSILLNEDESEKEADRDYFPIRRAILLRSMLERIFGFTKGKSIDIHPGVLNALLFTPRVLHGARSLESILSMSELTSGGRIDTGNLCQKAQCRLHVDVDEFEKYLNGTESRGDQDEATPENKQRYAWIERKSGRAYNPGTVVPAAPPAGLGAA
ncbi:hypothetical protein BO79DRAFT_278658 [Aspergillus costaricaensis CBS 115574]|uniref:Uncharacterized protein n=1 Tax=Aspergillus costaricaensis CBS 115574 TaxID=1448317 RepID=A0ACD1IQK1_9EURO|nr:hypothetical protein BO79DRAFT_278658 [Aspergillus costaricaensis CBS 115574]RAK91952.1 hypothetical protein BO79DRAFT_278658 [Aspergillus costaricaensis CBS 115574]